MNLMVDFAPAYPPLNGDPLTAAPLEIAITELPGVSGDRSASRIQWNACATSTFQFLLKVCQLCSDSGLMCGEAPAPSTSVRGRCSATRRLAVAGSAASAATAVKPSPNASLTSSR